MDSQRNILIIAILFVSFIIWQTWKHDINSQLQQQSAQNVATSIATTTNVITTANNISNKTAVYCQGKKINVRTDVLDLTINTCGGDIEQALLLSYQKELKSNEPFRLLETTPWFIYQAQSGLIGRDGPDNPIKGIRPMYRVEKDNFKLASGQNEIIVPMNYIDATGNTFTKIFTLKRGEYVVNVSYNIRNIGAKPIEVSAFGQLKQFINLPSYRDTNSNFALHTFRGAAYSTSDLKYEKYKFNSIADNNNLHVTSKGGWIAMLQQYFTVAWIPDSNNMNDLYTANLDNGIVAIGYKSKPVLIQPNQNSKLISYIWIGPKIQDKMAAIAPNLNLTVDYGWLWFISQPLFKLLKFIHNFLGNWGWSIITITFIVRGITYPLTRAQYISIAKMHLLQPKIQAIRERLSNDKHRQYQEILILYKKEKINLLGGCFPLLIQMPIFLALYYMLVGSVELRHAPLALWIHDLSAQDPYYIMPILMGITMFFIQKMSPTNVTDQTQQKIMTFIPIIFTIFFLWFPSGLVLYYIVNNLVTIIQQQLIFRGLEKHGLHNSKRKKS